MVTMKRKERRESAKENGRREKRGEASFHPALAPLQRPYYTCCLSILFSWAFISVCPGCSLPQGLYPLGPNTGCLPWARITLGCLWP